MSHPYEARLVVNNDQATVVDAAEALLDWITDETKDVHVEVYDGEMNLMASVECAKNDEGRWKAVNVE